MVKRLEKRNFTTEEARDLCYRRASDKSDDDVSEENSDQSFDSGAEAMFQEGRDITLDKQSSDSDTAWEPVTSCLASKRPRRVEQQDSSSGEEPNPPTPQRGSASRRRPRGRGRGGRGRARGRSSSSRSQAGVSAIPSGERWNDVDEADVTPPQPTFRPIRLPGPQLISTATYTVLQLFQMYFTDSILMTVLLNTNDFGSKNYSTPTKPWNSLTIKDMFSFMSMVIYMGIVKCRGLNDYWRQSQLYNLPFPRHVMSGRKFLRISRALHLSSLEADAANEKKRGTADYDRLCKIKPIYQDIREACKWNYR